MSIFDSLRKLFGSADHDASPPNGEPNAEGSRAPDDISCAEALRQVQEFLDGELPSASAEQLRHHFEVCSRCYPHLDFEKAYREAVRRALSGQGAPPELRERVASLISEQGSK